MKKSEKINLGLIIILAIVLRVILLDKFPYGFHFDEAKAAWNAISIALTGGDDQGNYLPSYYNSFGDYRPTGIIYMVIPFVLALGRTILAVRLGPALVGALTVLPIYLLARELSPKDSKTNLGLWAGLLLAINPWHITISRATSEVIVAMFLALWGLLFLIKALKQNSWRWAIGAATMLLFSYGFYHSIRILAPILGLSTVSYFWLSKNKEIKYKWGVATVLVTILVTGMIMLSPQARGRLTQVSLKNDFAITYETLKMPNEEGHNSVLLARTFHNKYAVMLRRFGEEYASYFGTDFLVGRTAKPNRYITTNFGLITYIEYFLLLMGIAAAVVKKDIRLVWLWLLIAPLPAAVTLEDVPNLHRSMMMVPAMVLIEAWGLSMLLEMNNKLVRAGLLGLWGVNFIYYLHFYYNHGVFGLSVYSRNSGIVELVDRLESLKGNYDKVIVSNYSDNPYAWYAYFENKDPHQFNQNYKKNEDGIYQYENIVFSNEKCPTASSFDKYKEGKILVINGEGCDYKGEGKVKAVETVKRKDESAVYKMWERI